MKKIAIAVLLTAFAAPAFAEGMYVGVTAGQNKYDEPTLPKQTSTSFGILGGYTLNENFAVEAAYTSLGTLDVASGFSVKGTVISLSGVGSFPLSSEFSLFAKLGVAQSKIDVTGQASESKSGATIGFGAQYNVTPGIGVRVGFDRCKVGETNSINADQTSVGLVFKL